MTNQKKFETLKTYLLEMGHANPEELEDLTIKNCFNDSYNTFEIIGNEYKVLTDEEADETAKTEILNSLWAFRAEFVLHHTVFYEDSTPTEDQAFIEALRDLQGRIAESATPIIKALIKNLDEFVFDAIDADGRGHFISWYDGREHELNDLYIYRIN